MPERRYNAEEIIHKLREADVLLGEGKGVSEVCKQIARFARASSRWGRSADLNAPTMTPSHLNMPLWLAGSLGKNNRIQPDE